MNSSTTAGANDSPIDDRSHRQEGNKLTLTWFGWSWCLIYSVLPILWVLYPEIFELFQYLFGGDSQVLKSKENTEAFRSFIILVAPLGYVYWLATYYGHTSLIALSIVWRLILVFPCLATSLLTTHSIELSAALLIASVDVLTPLLAIYFCPNILKESPAILNYHFIQKPIDSSRKTLLYVGLSGMALYAFMLIYLFRLSNPGYLQAMPMCLVFIYNIFFFWLSKLQDPRGADTLFVFHALTIVALALDCFLFKYRPFWVVAVALLHTSVGAFLFHWTARNAVKKVKVEEDEVVRSSEPTSSFARVIAVVQQERRPREGNDFVHSSEPTSSFTRDSTKVQQYRAA